MVTIRRYVGVAIEPLIAELARLRIAIFRAYPYLYDGTLAYEAAYLRNYCRVDESVVVVAEAGDRVVGASTGLPLCTADPAFQAPFLEHGYDLDRIFYFGESVLEEAYRGQGIGVRFFAERTAHARALDGFDTLAFCAVERTLDHPARPANYVPLNRFWERRGFVRHPELVAQLAWQDVGESGESLKPLTFWLRSIASSDGEGA